MFGAYKRLSVDEIFDRIKDEEIAIQAYALSLYPQKMIEGFFIIYKRAEDWQFLKKPVDREARIDCLKIEVSETDRIIDKNSFEYKTVIKLLLSKKKSKKILKVPAIKWSKEETERLENLPSRGSNNGSCGSIPLRYSKNTEKARSNAVEKMKALLMSNPPNIMTNHVSGWQPLRFDGIDNEEEESSDNNDPSATLRDAVAKQVEWEKNPLNPDNVLKALFTDSKKVD